MGLVALQCEWPKLGSGSKEYLYEAVLLLDLVTRLDGANRSDAADVGEFL